MKIKTFKFPHTIAREGTNIEADRYFVRILKMVFKFYGIIVVPGDKVTPQFVLAILMSHTLILSFFFVLFSDISLSAKLEAFCIISGVFQGIFKMYTAFFRGSKFRKLLSLLRKLHLTYTDHPEIGPVLKDICVYAVMLVECLTVAFYCVIISFVLLPLFLWKKFGVVATIFPIQFPFIDWHTTIGYLINTVDHAYCAIAGLTGLLAADAAFLYFVLHPIGYCKIFETRTNELDTILLTPGPQNKREIREKLNACIRAHQDYINYIAMVDHVFSDACMVQMITAEIFLSGSLILTLWVKWILGPFLAIVGLFQILQYCVLGTVITVQNEKVSDLTYGFSWYLLPVEQQKIILFMIKRAQKPRELNVGAFAKLNVETSMSILKATYSFVMMMVEFLKYLIIYYLILNR